MCILSADDQPSDAPPCQHREAADRTFAAMIRALCAQHDLLRSLDEGAVAADFGNACPDARILAVTRAANEATHAYRLAAHTLMVGEPYRLSLTSMSLAIEAQRRLGRNGGVRQIEAHATRLPAVTSPEMA